MFHIGLQTRDIVTFENYQPSTKQNKTKQNKTRTISTINKSNGVFVIEIKD